jgi:hypothetical protein
LRLESIAAAAELIKAKSFTRQRFLVCVPWAEFGRCSAIAGADQFGDMADRCRRRIPLALKAASSVSWIAFAAS